MRQPDYHESLLAAALELASKGWAIFPVKARGKVPLTANGLKDATTDPAQIREWWDRWPSANLGVATGSVVVIDVDGDAGERSLATLETEFGPLPSTLQSRTGRGRHLFFAANGTTIRNSAGKVGRGLDCRAHGGYVIAPPSIHQSGRRYEWVSGDAPLAPLPAWLAEKLRASTPHTRASTNGHKVSTGQRNSTLVSVAGTMRRKGLSETAILAALLQHNEDDCDPPLPESEIRTIAASVGRYPAADSPPEPRSSGLIVGNQGNLRPIIANAIIVLREAPEWRNVLAYNEFSLYTVTKNPAPWQTSGGAAWTDHDDSKTAEWLQHHGVLVNSKLAAEAAQVLARENAFHPVRDYLRGLQWDGKPRLDDWLTTYAGAPRTPFSVAVGPRWLISGVARVEKPGCRVDHTTILEGPQGTQKSTLLEKLAGEWFADSISDLGNKDSKIELHGVWIIELAELASVKRGAQVERIKAFLTSPTDHFRMPYAKRASHVPRQNIFAGSVNDATYLTDETGNRRFWPIPCGKIDVEGMVRDRDQIWAEAYRRYSEGQYWWLDTAPLNALAGEEQEKRYAAGPWDDAILSWLDDPTPKDHFVEFHSTRDRVTISDILIQVCGKSVKDFNQRDQNTVVRCLVHAGWKRVRGPRDANRPRPWFYERPEQ